MKEFIDEYGGVVATALSAFIIIGIISLIIAPGNSLHDAVVNLVMASMP